MTRTLVFGDIHGCVDEFSKLLADVAVCPSDHIVLAGDLLDRGPDSVSVVRLCRALQASNPLTLVLGNHESKHARYRRHVRLGREAVAMQMTRGAHSQLAQITADLSPEDVAFLDSGVLFAVLPEHNTLVVHAGVSPLLQTLPASAVFDLDNMDKAAKTQAAAFLMLRYCTPKGQMVALGSEKPDDRFWTDFYDGRFGCVLYGHQPYYHAEQPVVRGLTVGIDLGCCFGGHLCCAVLEQGRTTAYVVVKAQAEYASPKFGETEN